MQRILDELMDIQVNDEVHKAAACAAGLRRQLSDRLLYVTELDAHRLWHDVFVASLTGAARTQCDLCEVLNRAISMADLAVKNMAEMTIPTEGEGGDGG